MLSQLENIKKVKDAVNKLLAESQKSIYVIIDGDKTLIPTDSTKFFFDYLSLEYTDIKNIFKEYGYSFEAFHNVANYYSRIEKNKYQLACVHSANSVNIYPQFLAFIKAVKSKVQVVVVTSGIAESWQNVIKNHSLDFVYLIGGNYFPDDKFIIDRQAKGVVVNMLANANKKIFAFGDTMIDFDMLKEADNSYLVVNESLNKDFIPFASKILHLKQISFSNFFHPDIPVIDLKEVERQILEI